MFTEQRLINFTFCGRNILISNRKKSKDGKIKDFAKKRLKLIYVFCYVFMDCLFYH